MAAPPVPPPADLRRAYRMGRARSAHSPGLYDPAYQLDGQTDMAVLPAGTGHVHCLYNDAVGSEQVSGAMAFV